jgi:hypothetical protein
MSSLKSLLKPERKPNSDAGQLASLGVYPLRL